MQNKQKIFGGLMPFGFQQVPNDRTGFASILYSAGIPVMTGGAMSGRQFRSVHQDKFNAALAAGKDPNKIMPWANDTAAKTQEQELANENASQGIQWTFPQYSQSWAFSPPPAPAYVMPPPFDKKKYK